MSRYTVRYSSESGHMQRTRQCPLRARSGHSRSLGERGNGGFRDLLAPLLEEVAAVRNLKRRGTPAYLLTQCCHHRRSEHRIFHPDGHERLPAPLMRPPFKRQKPRYKASKSGHSRLTAAGILVPSCGVAFVSGGVAMTPKHLVGALMFAASLWSYPANALTFQFSFNNDVNNDPAQSLVVGIISGLQDNLANQLAPSVQVTSNPAGFGVGEYASPSTTANLFSVSGGVLTSADFVAFGGFPPAVTCCTLAFTTSSGGLAGLGNNPGEAFGNSTNLTFTAIAETPLPAALPLFASGAGVLGFIGWRRKKKAVALAP